MADPLVAAPVLAEAEPPSEGEKKDSSLDHPAGAALQPLFAFVQPAIAADLSAALPAPSREINYVQVNRDLLTGKASPFWRQPGEGRVHLPLSRGGALAVTIETTEQLGPHRFTSTGRIEGRPLSRAVFAVTEDLIHATVEDPLLGSFVLRVATENLSQFYRVDPDLVPGCGGSRLPPALGKVSPDPQGSRHASPASSAVANDLSSATAQDGGVGSPPIGAAANPTRVEIHVMMVHTEAVLPTLSGGARTAALQSAFDAAIARVNAAFDASLITARLRLVRVHETRYNEGVSAGNKVQDEALTALHAADDGMMDEIHALRDQVGADIVCLAVQRPDFASSGLSFLLTPGRLDNDEYAFSVVQYGNIAGTNVVAHEFGHVLGCAHDRQNSQGADGAFSYSYGFRFFGADGRQYHDIMSYPPGTELGYFSNPDVFVPAPVNAAIGIAAGRSGESNTARTIEQMAFLTASYRLQTQLAPNPGVLINVATRAYVGRDEQVLIGGFVIDGVQPKRMLVRGAGPALISLGVPDALANPVLHVYGGAVQVAENDDWGGGAELLTTFASVGAFPFGAGSTDSALLVTLPPGAYTAILEGVGAATGSGLIEVYDADRSANKIVNLSTRGFADRSGREMFGGFVVNGVQGTTKRILVRVLGPSLGRAPFNMTGVLDDPLMELMDSNGDLILTSDDWSGDSEGGVSNENDHRPLVKSYGERQIFATGYAPGNRREPCILVDLAPGSYTVVVMPFERLSGNPFFHQPARPGVGIVEVYEINP